MEAKDTKDKLHTLILENRTRLTIDGINNVVGFDEDGIELNSTHGRIFIEGSELASVNVGVFEDERTADRQKDRKRP